MRKLFGIAVLALLATPASALAANQYTVTTTADNTTVDTQCSLREATVVSNGGVAPDCAPTGSPSVNTIIFSPTLGANPLINLNAANGQLLVNTNDVTIVGPATVNGALNSGFRVLASIAVNTTLTGMTISGGSESSVGSGGGINVNAGGTLTLTNSIVSGNKTTQTGTGATTDGGGFAAATRSCTSRSAAIIRPKSGPPRPAQAPDQLAFAQTPGGLSDRTSSTCT